MEVKPRVAGELAVVANVLLCGVESFLAGWCPPMDEVDAG